MSLSRLLPVLICAIVWGGAGVDLRAAQPVFPNGSYTLRESWTYNKSYSGLGRFQIRTEKDGRMVVVDRQTKRIDWVFFPSGRLTVWRVNDGKRSLWTGAWSRSKNSVSVTARSGSHSASATFRQLNSREWKMTGVHKVRGKKIGTGIGTLRRSP